MKKALLIVILTVMVVFESSAQTTKSQFCFNTRAWSTNYWTSLLYSVADGAVTYFLTNGGTEDKTLFEALIPDADLVFPVGMAKEGFVAPNEIYGPYHRAFSNPFKRIGDWGVGVDLSWSPSYVGIYAGAYYKSQEICFKSLDQNLRAFYVQPRCGLVIGGSQTAVEAGVYYDQVVGASGSWTNWGTPDKEMFSNGWGLDFSLSYTLKGSHTKTMLMFSMPLHNFLNQEYAAYDLGAMVRKVGYISLTHRIIF